MTLLEAFSRFGPLIGDPAEDAVREEAGEVILRELRRLAASTRGERNLVEDAVSLAYTRMLQMTSRSLRVGAPQNDAQVRSYLRKALTNNYIDLVRQRRHEGELPARPDAAHDRFEELAEDRAIWRHEPGEDPVGRLSSEQLARACDDVYAELTASVCRGTGDDHWLPRAIAQLREIASGTVSLDEVARRLNPDPDRTFRNRLYQHHRRARKVVVDWVERELQKPNMTQLRADALRVVRYDMRARAGTA